MSGICSAHQGHDRACRLCNTPYKVLVCGSRTMPWSMLDRVLDVLRCLEPKPTLIIQGGAAGADQIAMTAAVYLGIPHQQFKADWKTYGKQAGHVRNQLMLDQNPDLVIAFHPTSGITRGTADMVRKANAKGTPVQIHPYEEEP